jgi:hypothetical protein
MSQLYVDNIRNRTGGPIGIPTGAVVTGVVTATTGNITGNLTVGGNADITGVLTYEDVTNVDSVGVVTARSGIEFGASGVGGTVTGVGNAEFVGVVTARSGIEFGASGVGGTITATGQAEFAGVVTATKFVGDGSELDNVISGVELQFDGSSVGAAVTNINLAGFSSVTAPVAGLSTITVAGWEVRDTWLYGGG